MKPTKNPVARVHPNDLRKLMRLQKAMKEAIAGLRTLDCVATTGCKASVEVVTPTAGEKGGVG